MVGIRECFPSLTRPSHGCKWRAGRRLCARRSPRRWPHTSLRRSWVPRGLGAEDDHDEAGNGRPSRSTRGRRAPSASRNQVHGVSARPAGRGTRLPPARGGHHPVRSDPSRLAIQTADCVPLLIADRRTGAVAAAHAGMEGDGGRRAAPRSPRSAREFGSRPGDPMAAVGPSIGASCYVRLGLTCGEGFWPLRFRCADRSRRWSGPGATGGTLVLRSWRRDERSTRGRRVRIRGQTSSPRCARPAIQRSSARIAATDRARASGRRDSSGRRP